MNVVAYASLLISLFLALFAGTAACAQGLGGRKDLVPWIERAHLAVTALTTFASGVLIRAFIIHDYSLVYVADYSDNFLPLFYRVTSFWAGQAGSLLFWAWLAGLAGAIFAMTPAYSRLSGRTKLYFWMFYSLVMAFFLLLLTCWSSPFKEFVNPPADGTGLNPLLQNPGMIFHPPLLFMGYAGFTVPACLALAQTFSGRTGEEGGWIDLSRNFILTAWLLLTAGIVLGGWWSYMELGWGGYWAWDPVENASLIPWLTGTAFLHTGVVQSKRGGLGRTNVFLIGLTLAMAFFATYLVRSGVIDSLHAFGTGGVGTPLLLFVILITGLSAFGPVFDPAPKGRLISGPTGREGFLVMTAWVLLALALVVMMGTMWPVVSSIWSDKPIGLEAKFYNKVCLPFFALLSILLAACPWLKWKSGIRNRGYGLAVVAAFVIFCALLWFSGVTRILPLIAAGSALAAVVGIVLVFVSDPAARKLRTSWGAYGAHLGLVLVVLGVAVSGPYQVAKEELLKPGQSMTVEGYSVTFNSIRQDQIPGMDYIEADLSVSRDGKAVGTLKPQRRIYAKYPNQYAEVSVIPGFGDEIYATLQGLTEKGDAAVKISVNPLVNWIWIGGTLMTLFPFLGLSRARGRREKD